MQNISYERRIVAYMDVLGFSHLVMDSYNKSEVFQTIYYAVQKLKQVKQDNYKGKDSLNTLLGIEVSVFSDNILISYPIEEGALFYLLMDIIHLQLDLLPQGILLRGGIAIGEAYHHDTTCFGPAVIEAVNIEQTLSKFPRILIKEDTVIQGILETYASQNGMELEAKYIYHLLQPCGEGFFVDFLNQESELDWVGGEYYSWMKEIRPIILNGLNNNISDPKILIKYEWLLDYYNKTVSEKQYISVPNPSEPEAEEYVNSFKGLLIRKIDGVYY